MVSYPVCCLSQFCGMILCDGCRNKPELVAHYRFKGPDALAKYEAGQDKLRAQKAEKSGPFIWMREAA